MKKELSHTSQVKELALLICKNKQAMELLKYTVLRIASPVAEAKHTKSKTRRRRTFSSKPTKACMTKVLPKSSPTKVESQYIARDLTLSEHQTDVLLLYKTEPSQLVALALTVIDHDELFCKITKAELLHKNFQKKEHSPNWSRLADQFNKWTWWIGTTILKQRSASKRASVISYFVDVAEDCLRMRNYNSAFAITSALNLASITRLKLTWAKVPSKKIAVYDGMLQKLVNPKNNSKIYRQILKSLSHQSEPVMPLLLMYSKDLFNVEESNDTTIKVKSIIYTMADVNNQTNKSKVGVPPRATPKKSSKTNITATVVDDDWCMTESEDELIWEEASSATHEKSPSLEITKGELELVNVNKLRMLYEIINEFVLFQQSKYETYLDMLDAKEKERLDYVKALLFDQLDFSSDSCKILSSDDLYKLSLTREARKT
eukprot:TRINITY_DN5182_c0_g2_i1.p1 TRINITY_DN5182_c0_g2~~TRINITY_DN5182_c0_g2_i1.p1  ORF type:complete len:439 (-),score=71.08 TRINITY_DN5182_c0_g2_i1:14-1309(-)